MAFVNQCSSDASRDLKKNKLFSGESLRRETQNDLIVICEELLSVSNFYGCHF